MKFHVLFYSDYPNPEKLPDDWPALVVEVKDGKRAESPWVEMTPDEYDLYRSSRVASLTREIPPEEIEAKIEREQLSAAADNAADIISGRGDTEERIVRLEKSFGLLLKQLNASGQILR